MTTTGRRRWLPLHALTALTCALFWVAFAPTGPAQADDCLVLDPVTGQITYVCNGDEPGEPGGPGDEGGGGSNGPSCDLKPPGTFCVGPNSCYWRDSVVPFAPPKSPPPTPDAEWKVRVCIGANLAESFDAIWIDPANPPTPPLIDQAWTAIGQLAPPVGELSVNPTTRSLVSLPTWFWADGLSGDDLTGSSAFGLVAIATPDYIEVDPGDGSGAVQCPWTTAQSDTCSHAYERSSATRGRASVDGHDAYAASGTPVWSLAFELNGNPINIPGAPPEFRGQTMDAGVWVAESQAVVTSRR
ncbi:hypothetical protein [Nocardioides iriomotensis]|uniref:ATP/GTP-binding protein n=1 Tax=Nocardioides iriomotensis TaxID=715784 RepID=A0A4Q5IUE9_9ACTN|nr:hypothetical protein [Nocardioides iriomotensis]RYU09472.1 hypothetical protein ETU37_20655 [Nocardioides iriomotensis]